MIDPINNFFQQRLTRKPFNFKSNSVFDKQSLRDTVIEFLHRENWEYTITKDPAILRMICQGDNGQWRCYAQIKEKQKQFIFYSVCSEQASSEKLLAIAEYISRVNYGVAMGNFELDFTDGEIRYKTSIKSHDNRLSISSVKHLVYTNVAMMDRYFPGILAIIEQDIEPSQAIKAIESLIH